MLCCDQVGWHQISHAQLHLLGLSRSYDLGPAIERYAVAVEPALDGRMLGMTQFPRQCADAPKARYDRLVVHIADCVQSVRTPVNVDCVNGMSDTGAVIDGRTTGQVLKALMGRAGLSLRGFAKACGYAHASGVQRYLDPAFDGQLANPVAVKMADALEGMGSPAISRAEVYALTGIGASEGLIQQFEGASMRRMHQDIPIVGTALGAEKILDGHAIEQTNLYSQEIIGYAKRPIMLEGRADAYGIYVQGSSMDPAFEDGALILVETRRQPAAGDNVIVHLRRRGEEDDGDDGESTRMVMVKRLVRRSAAFVEVEQHNPKLCFRIDMKDVLKLHRVIPWAELLS